MASPDQQYYGIISALPPLPRQGQEGFRFVNNAEAFYSLLSPQDKELLQLAYIQIDHENLLYKIRGMKRTVSGGNFDEDQIRAISEGQWFPYPYLAEVFEENTQTNRGVDPTELERKLHRLYFQFLLNQSNAVLHQWAVWQLGIKLTTLRLSLANVLTSTQFDIEAIKTILDQSFPDSGEENLLPEALRNILKNPDIYQREYETDQWLWDQLENSLIFDPFSIDALISYSLRQQLCARWSGFIGNNSQNVLDLIIEETLTAKI
jgi:hypothetical protein